MLFQIYIYTDFVETLNNSLSICNHIQFTFYFTLLVEKNAIH